MKKFLFVSLCIFFNITLYAEKIIVDDIYYTITSSNTAEVTYRGDEEDGWMYYSADELYSGEITIPETISYQNTTYSVTAIGNDAFAGSRYMTDLILPSTITTMGSGIFTLCYNLRTITVAQENPTFYSENGILYKKNPLTIYFVPRNIQGDIVLSDDITEIPSSAFQNCTNITTIQIPENVTTIADGAFNSCTNLAEIFLNNNLQTIGVQAFSKCTSLQLLTIPESVKTIGASAFTDCSNLCYLILNEGLQTIEKYAFYNCENIVNISLPSTLTSIGDKAFDGCTSLTTIQNNSALTLIPGSETNGCVAKYVTSIELEPQTETNIRLLNTDLKNSIFYNNTTNQIEIDLEDNTRLDYEIAIYTTKGECITKQHCTTAKTKISIPQLMNCIVSIQKNHKPIANKVVSCK